MKQVQVTTRATRRRDRDGELRQAHQVAFSKMAAGTGRHQEIALAIEELIDACEAYIDAE
jgi:hypothetical protein